jgi:uncharacterized protein with PIN domain
METITTATIDDDDKINDVTIGNFDRYIVDPSLPGVSRHCRMLGIDCASDTNMTDAYILYLARQEDRLIVTRSSRLLHRLKQEREKQQRRFVKLEKYEKLLQEYKASHQEEEWDEDTIEHYEEQIEILRDDIHSDYKYRYYWVEQLGRKQQLKEVVQNLRMVFLQDNMFTRCSKCNGINVPIPDKTTVKDQVHANVYADNDYFAQCNKCNWITWGIFAQNPLQEVFHRNAVAFCEEFSYKPESDTSSSSGSSSSSSSSNNGSSSNENDQNCDSSILE